MAGTNRGNLGGNSSTGGFSGTASIGLSAGEKGHMQVRNEVGDHDHNYNGATSTSTQPTQGGGAAPASLVTGNTNRTGSQVALNVTQPTSTANLLLKL